MLLVNILISFFTSYSYSQMWPELLTCWGNGALTNLWAIGTKLALACCRVPCAADASYRPMIGVRRCSRRCDAQSVASSAEAHPTADIYFKMPPRATYSRAGGLWPIVSAAE